MAEGGFDKDPYGFSTISGFYGPGSTLCYFLIVIAYYIDAFSYVYNIRRRPKIAVDTEAQLPSLQYTDGPTASTGSADGGAFEASEAPAPSEVEAEQLTEEISEAWLGPDLDESSATAGTEAFEMKNLRIQDHEIGTSRGEIWPPRTSGQSLKANQKCLSAPDIKQDMLPNKSIRATPPQQLGEIDSPPPMESIAVSDPESISGAPLMPPHHPGTISPAPGPTAASLVFNVENVSESAPADLLQLLQQEYEEEGGGGGEHDTTGLQGKDREKPKGAVLSINFVLLLTYHITVFVDMCLRLTHYDPSRDDFDPSEFGPLVTVLVAYNVSELIILFAMLTGFICTSLAVELAHYRNVDGRRPSYQLSLLTGTFFIHGVAMAYMGVVGNDLENACKRDSKDSRANLKVNVNSQWTEMIGVNVSQSSLWFFDESLPKRDCVWPLVGLIGAAGKDRLCSGCILVAWALLDICAIILVPAFIILFITSAGQLLHYKSPRIVAAAIITALFLGIFLFIVSGSAIILIPNSHYINTLLRGFKYLEASPGSLLDMDQVFAMIGGLIALGYSGYYAFAPLIPSRWYLRLRNRPRAP
ncbi:hypothetical protein ABW19_dt0204882 [Dactylella cylindrospora]|nr:hypothetical protein ABW19_dt0204882 [Dactylella cylindrospora]